MNLQEDISFGNKRLAERHFYLSIITCYGKSIPLQACHDVFGCVFH